MSTKKRTKSKKNHKQSTSSPKKSKKPSRSPKQSKTPSKSSQSKKQSKTPNKANITVARAYPKSTSYASLSIPCFLFAVVIRITSALLNPISDCDETFNYWEPTAFLLNNYGFQTWEYSPLYALRSYSYLLPQYGFAHLLRTSSFSSTLFTTQPFYLFYAIRILLSIVCLLCEYYFASSLTPWFGKRTSFFTFVLLAFSSGMFNCCAAYLPQQFVVCMLLLSFGSFYRHYRVCAIWFMGCAIIIGWPFIALLAVPMAVDCILFYGMIGFVAYGVVFGAILGGASVAVDYYFYGKYVLPPLNIILYNLSLSTSTSDESSLSGQNLYGVDDWRYYVKNLLLNWNIAYVLAIVAPLASNWMVLLLCKRRNRNRKGFRARLWDILKFGHDSMVCRLLQCIAPLWIWSLFFMYMPHKEERFMFVIYPFIALNAAITLTQFRMFKLDGMDVKLLKHVKTALVAVFIVLCASRSVGQVMYYKGSMDIWYETGEYIRNNGSDTSKVVNICVGKEWYRIPSSLFVSDVAQIKWIKSGFDGQLPAEFEATNTVNAKQPFNDQNKMEMSRFVDDVSATCEYIVDLWESNSVIEAYDVSKYRVVKSVPFLDREATQSSVFRSLYIPILSDRKVVYANYKLLERRKEDEE